MASTYVAVTSLEEAELYHKEGMLHFSPGNGKWLSQDQFHCVPPQYAEVKARWWAILVEEDDNPNEDDV